MGDVVVFRVIDTGFRPSEPENVLNLKWGSFMFTQCSLPLGLSGRRSYSSDRFLPGLRRYL